MRIITAIFLIHLATTVSAQDYPDYRSKRDNFAKIPQKDVKADLATFTLAGIDESIGKLPLKSIPATSTDNSHMKFEGENIQVLINAEKFDPAKHKIQYYDEKKYVVRIDGKPFYGNYGEMPASVISKVTVVIGKDSVNIPQTAYFDLYSPVFTYRDRSGTVKTHNGVYLSNDGKKIYVYMLNEETKGKYEVTWVIQDKQYLRRVLDFNLMQ